MAKKTVFLARSFSRQPRALLRVRLSLSLAASRFFLIIASRFYSDYGRSFFLCVLSALKQANHWYVCMSVCLSNWPIEPNSKSTGLSICVSDRSDCLPDWCLYLCMLEGRPCGDVHGTDNRLGQGERSLYGPIFPTPRAILACVTPPTPLLFFTYTILLY